MSESSFSNEVETPESETPDTDVSGETSAFTAACQSGHQWLGTRRTGTDAFEKAQADADAHNEKFPGHEAGVIGA